MKKKTLPTKEVISAVQGALNVCNGLAYVDHLDGIMNRWYRYGVADLARRLGVSVEYKDIDGETILSIKEEK